MKTFSHLAIACVAATLAFLAAAPARAQTTAQITTSTTISSGTSYLRLSVGSNTASPVTTLTINSGSITISGPSGIGFAVGTEAQPYAAVVQNGGSVTFGGSTGQLYLGVNLDSPNTAYSGSASYTLNSGTITLGNVATAASASNLLMLGRSTGNNTFTQNGGLVQVYRTGTAAAVLSIGSVGTGGNLYALTGGTFEGIGSATVAPGNGGGLIVGTTGSGTLTINGAGATMAIEQANAVLARGTASSTVNVQNGTLALNGNLTRGDSGLPSYSPGTVSFTLGGGTLRPYNGNLVVGSSTAANTAAFDITLAANSLSTITGIGWKSGSAHTVTLLSNLVGSGSVQFTGGTVVLAGTNSYTGSTDVTAGMLSISNTTALPGWNVADRLVVRTGATLAVGNAVTDASVATLVTTGSNFRAGSAIGFDTTAGNRTITAAIPDNAQGGLGLVKIGSGTLTLSASNSYTGNTTVSAGTLLLSDSNALRGSTFSGGGGTLAFTRQVNDIFNNMYYLGGLSGSSSLSLLDTGRLSIRLLFGFNNADTTFSGNLTDGEIINKLGTGTTTLSGNISTGTAGGSISATQGGLRQTGGTITLNRNNGSGVFTVGIGSGTTGTYVLESGTVLATSTASGHMRIGILGGTGIFTINGSSARAYFSGTNNTIGGNDMAVQSGTGTLDLRAGELAVNSLTTGTVAGSQGTFHFSGGTLRPYSQDTSIGRSGSGFTIALGGTSATFSGLDAAAGTARTLTVLATLVNGTAGAGGAIFSGGTVSLAAANTYSGATTIAGTNTTLVLGSAGSFANSPTIRVGNAGSSGAILDLTAKTGTFSFTSGQTVGGIGTINIGSGKTVSSAGLWAPGNSIGSNAVTGNLSLSGTSQFELGTPGTSTLAPGLSDFTAVSGTLTLGGALNLVNNAGADGNGAVAGGVYRLFTYGAVSGSYASVTTNPSATTVTGLNNISYGGPGTSAGQGVFLTVYDRAVASFGSGPTALTTLTLDFLSVNQGDSVSPLNFSLYNLLQTAGFTADLALLSITPDVGNTDALSTNLSTFNSLASGTFNSWQASVNTSNQGTFTNTWTLEFKSANGGTAYSADTPQFLTLTTNVIIVPEPGAIALAGIGIAAAAWATRRRK